MNEKALRKAADYMSGWIRILYEHETYPGFVVAVASRGDIIFNEAYGYASLASKEKMTTDHIFRIASHSKTFTATAVMQLQEKGKLKIDDSVAAYLPWLKKHKDTRWQKVTIRQLLSHSAGIIRDGVNSDYWQLEAPFPDREQLKKDILASKLIIDNNTKLKYSNYGYSLLGMLIERISGKSYYDFVMANIVEPLGLENTGPEYTPRIDAKLATGYSRDDFNRKRLPIAHIDTKGMASATGFYSTSEDLCKYFIAHSTGTGKLLDDESKKEMQRVQWQIEGVRDKTDYGLGFEIEYVNKHTLIGHGGGFPGFITKTYADPRDELVVTVLTNANGTWPAHLASSIIKAIDFFQDRCSGRNKYEKYEGKYMYLWGVEDFIAAGDKLIVAQGNYWEPFENPDELEHIKGDVFKISKTDGFSSVNEEVKFKIDDSGKVELVIYAGETRWLDKDYLKKMSTKQIID